MNKGFDKETLDLTMESLRDFLTAQLPDKKVLDLDAREEFPVEIIREMCSPDGLGIQLVFIRYEQAFHKSNERYHRCRRLPPSVRIRAADHGSAHGATGGLTHLPLHGCNLLIKIADGAINRVGLFPTQ